MIFSERLEGVRSAPAIITKFIPIYVLRYDAGTLSTTYTKSAAVYNFILQKDLSK
jgi:hypothetical protein